MGTGRGCGAQSDAVGTSMGWLSSGIPAQKARHSIPQHPTAGGFGGARALTMSLGTGEGWEDPGPVGSRLFGVWFCSAPRSHHGQAAPGLGFVVPQVWGM